MKTTTIDRELSENGRCLIQTVGVSMEPLLHNRYSTAVIERAARPLRRSDVVLFRRPNDGDYVLHRVVRMCRDGYIIRGDNCMQNEYVTPEQILGIMTGYFNGDTYVDCASDAAYRRYMRSIGVRYAWHWCRVLPGRMLHKLRRMCGK